ncbi:helix-turn-helix domain-containing protein [Paenibacillus sp. HW567]|uniref:helix-turn-helix domain-containing protein n=1 Tax=Paenibacillus sp. HW567 TaxID=1034769 RepID=UPI00036D5CCB|nr:helix-turn-helix transcriptional regulator [Paenibacillus sp. HW567]
MSNVSTLVGEKIRMIRQQKGFSQESLAFKAGLTPSYVGQVERGQKSATIDTLEKIAVSLDVTLEEIFRSATMNSVEMDYSTLDKIIFQLHGRSQDEQDAIYQMVKQILAFKDQR